MALPFPSQYATILVVDDERIPRRVAYRLLTEEGLRVLEAASADEALDVLGQAGGRLDLVIIDVVMPQVDGVELAGLIQAEWPDVPVLFMSAYPAQVLAQRGLEDLDVVFLAKPYTRDELMTRIRKAIARRRHPRESRDRPLPDE